MHRTLAADGSRADPVAVQARAIAGEVRSDLWFYACVLAYLGAAWVLARSLDAEPHLRPLLYVENWVRELAVLAPLGLLVWLIGLSVRRRALPGFREAFADLLRARLISGLLMFCGLAVFFGTFTSVKNLLPRLAPFAWDQRLADLDRALHGGTDPGAYLLALLGQRSVEWLDYAYGIVWFTLLIGISGWAAVSARHAGLRRRYFITFVACWTLIGNVLAGLFMSAGPCFFAAMTGDEVRFAGLLASGAPSALGYQDYLWRLHESGEVYLASGISAFPSMHVGMATLMALFLWSVSRSLGLIGVVFVLIIQIGSVRLGWHYAVDGYVSIVLTLLLWGAAGFVGSLTPQTWHILGHHRLRQG